MNVFLNNTQNFIKIFKENCRKEIHNNKQLHYKLSTYKHKYNSVIETLSNSLPLKLLNKSILVPLKLTDAVLIQCFKSFNYDLTSIIHKKLTDNASKKMFSWIDALDVPQFYGGKLKKMKPVKIKQSGINRDEVSIENIENTILPNIFFNSSYMCKDKNIRDIMHNFYENIRNRFFLQPYDFYTIKCIDLRNTESDGYTIDEEIEIDFLLQVRVKYFTDYMRNEILYYKCKMKFDGDDQVINFTYDEI